MGYDMYGVENNEYFRANIWGMGFLRSVMRMAEALDEEVPSPEFPEIEKRDDETEEQYEMRLQESQDEITSISPGVKPPFYKFCSNDGWFLTPEECRVIADAIDKYVDEHEEYTWSSWDGEVKTVKRGDDDDNFVREFSAYCRKMSESGGFKVY
jgi:hypothetical protein